MDTQRGKIVNRHSASQIRDFSKLRYGTITPTDIDAVIDFGNKAFIFIETKYLDAPIYYGQKLAIERLTDLIEQSGKYAIALIAQHWTHWSKGDINFANCIVTEYRWKRRWVKMEYAITVKKCIDGFLKKHLPEYLTVPKH